MQCVSFVERALPLEIRTKGGYFSKVPHLMSEADDPDIARECAKQLTALSDDALAKDPLLRRQKNEYLADLNVQRKNLGKVRKVKILLI